MKQITIIIVDDHKIIRDGLIAILKDVTTIKVVGDVSSGQALLEMLKLQSVDVVLLDMHMPLENGIEVTRAVKEQFPQVKVLINTMSELPEEIEQSVAAGISGYLLKTSGSDELIKAIQMVAHGNSYFGTPIINTYIRNLTKAKPIGKDLSPTELRIVKLLYAEKKHREIIEELVISQTSLNNHLQSIYRKLNINSEIGIVKYALQEKLIN